MSRNIFRIGMVAGALLLAASVSNAQSVTGSITGGKVTRGKAARGTVNLNIPGGLHTNSNRPNSEYAIATTVRVSGPRGVKVSAVTYPRGHNKKFAFSENPLNVYEGRVAFPFIVTVPASYQGQTVRLNVSVKYQACTQEVCYAPKTKSMALTATVQ